MATNSKSYMNFLGGEVSPNVYKRLDMANNGKWFETAKNIYFGTTGDFQNRRGFIHIGELPNGQQAGEKLKLLPFVFNRSQAYCIAFYASGFCVLKNGAYLKDNGGNVISVPHPGVTLESDNDLSYCQIGDILYIAAPNASSIYTITRKSDTEWEWDEFNFDIPPTGSVNQDQGKTLTFSTATGQTSVWRATVSLSGLGFSFGDITVKLSYKNNNSTQQISLLQTNTSFNSIPDFVLFFNANNTRTDLVSEAQSSGNDVIFTYTSSALSLGTELKTTILISSGADVEEHNISSTGFTGFDGYYTIQSGEFTKRYWNMQIPANAAIHSCTGAYVRQRVPGIENFEHVYPTPLTRAEFVAAINAEALTISDMFQLDYMEEVDASSLQRLGYFAWYQVDPVLCYVEFSNITYTVPSSSQSPVSFVSGDPEEMATNSLSLYSVASTFPFFENKRIGEFFSVESVYSPSATGKAGENKTVYIDSGWSSLETATTDGFWSNGTWRIVTSGIFEGRIELQYSYDNQIWFSHRTFSSTVRTENNVSYGTNYNEYGTIDADDNVYLRLKFDIDSTKQQNLCVMLDTESFKNKSYFKILSITDDYHATVECVKYNIGTPGLANYDEQSQTYIVNPIYEWSQPSWSFENGMPQKVFFYQNRLAFANTKKEPYSIWFSRTDNYKDFSTKIEYADDDPITIKALRSTGVSEINTVASAKKLFVFTADHEDGIQDEGALTQANKQLIGFTYYGCEPIETRNVSNKIIFVEKGGHAARALTYDFSQDNYDAIDLTIPYKHLLTNEKIIATEYLPGDYKVYLMLTSAGRILCFKYLPEQKIEACSWFQHANGEITNLCVVPNIDGYNLYIAINSGSHKFIEYLDINNSTNGVYLDSYKLYSYDLAVSSITDTNYFVPGKKYTVLTSDGKYFVTADSTSSISLRNSMKNISVGVSYDSEATLIEPNLSFRDGSTTNYNRKNMFKAFFSYSDSIGFKVGVKNKQKSFKQVFALPLSSIDVERERAFGERNFILQSSYLEPNMLSFVQEEPYKMHITNAEVEVDYGGK